MFHIEISCNLLNSRGICQLVHLVPYSVVMFVLSGSIEGTIHDSRFREYSEK